MRGSHRSMRAGSAVTAGMGCGAAAMKPRIISGLTLTWHQAKPPISAASRIAATARMVMRFIDGPFGGGQSAARPRAEAFLYPLPEPGGGSLGTTVDHPSAAAGSYHRAGRLSAEISGLGGDDETGMDALRGTGDQPALNQLKAPATKTYRAAFPRVTRRKNRRKSIRITPATTVSASPTNGTHAKASVQKPYLPNQPTARSYFSGPTGNQRRSRKFDMKRP